RILSTCAFALRELWLPVARRAGRTSKLCAAASQKIRWALDNHVSRAVCIWSAMEKRLLALSAPGQNRARYDRDLRRLFREHRHDREGDPCLRFPETGAPGSGHV